MRFYFTSLACTFVIGVGGLLFTWATYGTISRVYASGILVVLATMAVRMALGHMVRRWRAPRWEPDVRASTLRKEQSQFDHILAVALLTWCAFAITMAASLIAAHGEIR
jgi:hypothetical protein